MNGELLHSEGAEPLTSDDTEGALKQLLSDDVKLDEFDAADQAGLERIAAIYVAGSAA